MRRRPFTTSALQSPSSHQLRSTSRTARSRSQSAIRPPLPPREHAIKDLSAYPTSTAWPVRVLPDSVAAPARFRHAVVGWTAGGPPGPGSSTAEHLPCNQAIGVQFSSRAPHFTLPAILRSSRERDPTANHAHVERPSLFAEALDVEGQCLLGVRSCLF